MANRPNARARRPAALNLGPLPTSVIKHALGLELAAGSVHFTARAQANAQRRHPDELALCLRHAGRVVAHPDYIGQGPGQTEGFELIGEARRDEALVLIAIKLKADQQGRYRIASTYLIDRDKLERRVRKGFLVRAQMQKGPASQGGAS